MDMTNLQCHGCGSGNVTFDPKRRVLKCNQCGKEEYYSRATLNSSGTVLFSKQNAIKFFMEGKIENAQHYSMDILNVSKDNAPALYIIAYYDEFNMKRDGALKEFFKTIRDIALEYDEVRDLMQLFKASSYNLMDFEFDLLTLLALNMQSDEDIPELEAFVDQVCPAFIGKRSTITYLKPENAEIYQELAEHCNIPKTCFALLKSIQTNPDSPFVSNTFYLKSRCRYFYEQYAEPIGKIVYGMKENEMKKKFIAYYEKLKAQFDRNLSS
ncbi:MAG: hypothetical protein LIO76_11385 [Clostridiales bacterium]|nr:hypothetical protein [Clostridiales bacterium]